MASICPFFKDFFNTDENEHIKEIFITNDRWLSKNERPKTLAPRKKQKEKMLRRLFYDNSLGGPNGKTQLETKQIHKIKYKVSVD